MVAMLILPASKWSCSTAISIDHFQGLKICYHHCSSQIHACMPFDTVQNPAGVGKSVDERKLAAKLDPELFKQLPDSFLSSHKSPCWHYHPPQPDYAGRNGPLLQRSPGPAELRCLPYFYVLGGFHSGAYSLYHMLEVHPDVAKVRIRCVCGGFSCVVLAGRS